MKVSKFRELSSEELVQKERTFKKELYDLNFQRKTSNVEKPSRFQALKKDIAKILTVLRERELEANKSKAS